MRDQRGSALVVALMVTTVMLSVGIAVATTIDTQQRASGRTRAGESSFQLAESALQAGLQRLVSRWPMPATPAYPVRCDPGARSADCPTTASLRALFTGPDFADGRATWSVAVRDDGAAPGDQYWSEDMLAAQPSYDADNDGRLWVRATSLVRGRPRTVVALAARPPVEPGLPPHKTLVAGSFATTNNGNKAIVLNGDAGEVVVRCGSGTVAAPAVPPKDGCAEYEGGNKEQVSPERVSSQRDFPPGMTPDRIEMARAQARSEGSYVATCPGSLQTVPNGLLFIEDAGPGCSLLAPGPAAAPGMVVAMRGRLRLGGNETFRGLIYHANADDSADVVVDLGGTSGVVGGILVDGAGAVFVGSSKDNLVFAEDAGQAFRPAGDAAIVQGSFREVAAR
ncbi:MAG TPA: PilX N-terminal domain-containing pilus assembly protein [Solirubrobacteraceae bacterium]|jgi:Tfp pilus assembly protein PilX